MSNIDDMMQKVSVVFNSIQSIVDGMENGNRMQLKELAQAVSDKCGARPQDALMFVTYFAQNTDSGYVNRGKGGGFFKGSKQDKALKSNKKQKSVSLDLEEDDA